MQRRKATFKLYPNTAQKKALEDWVRLHCELYNAALEERIGAWQKSRLSITYYDQQNALPEIKKDRPELVPLGSHALQQTLRRLDLAMQSFFRRVKKGETPGFPRFKSPSRFSGFSYPDPAGWKLLSNGIRGATVRLGSGKNAMMIRARGMHRFAEFAPNDLTITRRHGEWFASVTLRVTEEECARERKDNQQRGIDFGINDWATFEDGSTIENPRFLRNELPKLAILQRERSRKKKGSIRYKRLTKQIGRLHERIANQRKDFVHKKTSQVVANCTVIATEELKTKNMSRSAKGSLEKPGKRVKQKSGLNREILSASFGMAHQMLAYKAEEAGTRLHLANTRQLKPSQRCCACWEITPKTLADRTHHCQNCGHTMPRDQNSAAVVLIDAYGIPDRDTAGTVVAARRRPLVRKNTKPRSKTRETHTTSAPAL